ncbi:MAG: D-alanyl-D-alanine carboxypeptidase [Clostridia bacterium]|nr:D-alanyl-D-alanine carboxypeptidase [Clostridia bacterium]
MKKITFILFSISLLSLLSFSSLAIDISAKYAILIESQSGDIVYAKNSTSKAPMASTTKIMTAIVALENGDLEKTVTIDERSVGVEGSSIYLKAGEKLTLKELIYALMLESANDAATAIAYEIGGSVENFASMMNETSKKIGAFDTNFTNPHGLDDDEHYTTAYDLAKIARYAMQNPVFREIVSTKTKNIPLDDSSTRLLVNHNKLLRSYDGAIGIKTGFTKKSGRCLVSCANVDGVELVCVTLNAPNDWNDHKKMLNYGFEQYESINLASKGDYSISLSCVNGSKASVLCTNRDDLSVTLKKGLKNDIRAVLEADQFLFAPVKKNDHVGRIVYYLGNEEIASLPIYASENVSGIKYKKSIFERIFG